MSNRGARARPAPFPDLFPDNDARFMHAAKPFHQLLQTPEGRLGRLRARCAQLAELDERVRAQLPAPLRDHCRVANLRNGVLVMQTESPSWNNLLRYHLPTLLRDLQASAGIPPLRSIRLTVMPASGAAPMPRQGPLIPLRMTPPTAALIASLAESLEDEALRRSLLRLARHGQAGGG